MDRLSCDVTRDLMAVYLDGACSEDSRRLVEDHMESCESCRHFLAILQADTNEKESSLQIDFMKKIRNVLFIQRYALFGIVLAMLLVVWSCDYFVSSPAYFYYFALPVLMVFAYAIMPEKSGALAVKGRQKNIKKARCVQKILFAVVVVLSVFVLLFSTVGLDSLLQSVLDGANPLGIEPHRLGPFVDHILLAAMGLSLVIMVLAAAFLEKKTWIWLMTQNLALLVLVLSMCLERLIRLLSDYESFAAQMHMDIAVLVAETVVVCVACGWHLWFTHKKISKEG